MERKGGVPEDGAMREKFESERRRDGIGNVGDAEIEVGQLDLQDVAHEDLKLVLVWPTNKKVRVQEDDQYNLML